MYEEGLSGPDSEGRGSHEPDLDEVLAELGRPYDASMSVNDLRALRGRDGLPDDAAQERLLISPEAVAALSGVSRTFENTPEAEMHNILEQVRDGLLNLPNEAPKLELSELPPDFMDAANVAPPSPQAPPFSE